MDHFCLYYQIKMRILSECEKERVFYSNILQNILTTVFLSPRDEQNEYDVGLRTGFCLDL